MLEITYDSLFKSFRLTIIICKLGWKSPPFHNMLPSPRYCTLLPIFYFLWPSCVMYSFIALDLLFFLKSIAESY